MMQTKLMQQMAQTIQNNQNNHPQQFFRSGTSGASF